MLGLGPANPLSFRSERTEVQVIRTLLVMSVFHVGFGGQMRLQGQVVDSTATVRGRVVEHETGVPVRGAAVSLATGPGTRGIGTRVTGQEGGFLFREAPPGLYRLSVTRIGYADLRDTLRVEAGSDLELALSVSTSPVVLEPIVVSVRRRPQGPMSGFESRRRGLTGTFITREEIEARRPHVFTDLLHWVPGARIVPLGPFRNRVTLRGGCVPELVVDGMRVGAEPEWDLFVRPGEVEALEVYHSPSVPVEFGSNPCGAVVVWTRRGEPSTSQGGFWWKALFAGSLIALSLLLAR